jgi:flagellar biosynthesis/type III secretory pathway protein FliH
MIKDIEKDMKIEKAFEDGYAKGRAEGAKITASIEHELSAKCNSLAEENNLLREELESIETEFVRLRAQMDVVYLIFGGK